MPEEILVPWPFWGDANSDAGKPIFSEGLAARRAALDFPHETAGSDVSRGLDWLCLYDGS
jgi:hypothetical protein